MGGSEVDVSPLRMLASVEREQAEVLAARARGVEIKDDFVFVDANRNHIDFLRDRLERQGHGGVIGSEIHIVPFRFEEAADGVISRIRAKGRAHRLLFFLDQSGWSAVTNDARAPSATREDQRIARTDRQATRRRTRCRRGD